MNGDGDNDELREETLVRGRRGSCGANVGIAYLYYIHTRGIDTVLDWVIALVYLGTFQFFTLKKMTYTWLVDKESRYPFAPEEMRRFGVAKKMNRQ